MMPDVSVVRAQRADCSKVVVAEWKGGNDQSCDVRCRGSETACRGRFRERDDDGGSEGDEGCAGAVCFKEDGVAGRRETSDCWWEWNLESGIWNPRKSPTAFV